MKALISHLIREHLPQIAAQSLMNCHVRGLHSIMFLNTPEQRIRLYIATPEHELWKNNIDTLGSLAAHPHHCNITIHCIKGAVVNLEYRPDKNGKYLAFRYMSAITMGEGAFHARPWFSPVSYSQMRAIGEGKSLELPANLIHSVSALPGCLTAWFVYEGREDKNYTSLSYSNQPLEETSFDGLYGKISEQEVVGLLEQVGLLEPTLVTA